MDVRNCRTCGRIFNYLSGAPICANCQKALNDKFDVVKEYIYKNPEASISEVAEIGEVSISQIHQWVREERLSFSERSSIGIDCENCGVTIKTGRFCKSCKDELSNNLRSAYPTTPVMNQKLRKDKEAKMRFLDN